MKFLVINLSWVVHRSDRGIFGVGLRLGWRDRVLALVVD